MEDKTVKTVKEIRIALYMIVFQLGAIIGILFTLATR